MSQRAARTLAGLGAVALVVLAVALVAGHRPFAGFVGHNGDHYYYASMSLQFAGWPYEDSLREAARYFSYPLPYRLLDRGYLNPQFSPLIYPRTALPLMSVPFVRAAGGLDGLWVPGVLCGLGSLVTVAVMAWRRFGRLAAASTIALFLFSVQATEFSFGIYTEAQTILVIALLLLVLPLDHVKRSWPSVLTACLLVGSLLFIRQVVVVPLAMVALGWLHALVTRHGWRNAWLPYSWILAAAAAVQWVSNVWAPYDPFLFLKAIFKVDSRSAVLRDIPARFWNSIVVDSHTVWTKDRALVLMVLLALVGAWKLRRTAWPAVTVGALLAGLLTTALNGTPTGFRYLSPALPSLVVLGGVGAAVLVSSLLAALRLPVRRTRVGTSPSTRRRALVGLGATAAACAVLVAGTIAEYQAAPLDSGTSAHVSRATAKPGTWPIVDDGGTLICAGDDAQIWFRSDDGTLYAFSGTAMARSFLTPRLMSRSAQPVAFSWTASADLLAQGIALCRGPASAP
ncbi:MAG TPA: hypothetical protein VFL59_10380 [Candidatus Nanopelagicales bacterium]|nr:hypothetical protein [Candidatus Nanopelagicales bacterium]